MQGLAAIAVLLATGYGFGMAGVLGGLTVSLVRNKMSAGVEGRVWTA